MHHLILGASWAIAAYPWFANDIRVLLLMSFASITTLIAHRLVKS